MRPAPWATPRTIAPEAGIGIISGWVCQASNVTITISPVGEGHQPDQTFNIGYGADRPDTVGDPVCSY